MKTLVSSSLIHPLLPIFYNKLFDAETLMLLRPLCRDMSLYWSFWQSYVLLAHLFSKDKRFHLIPLYLVVIYQCFTLTLNHFDVAQTHPQSISIQKAIVELCIIFICTGLSFMFPIPSTIHKAIFTPSFLDVYWTRITSHQRSGFVKIPVRIYYPATAKIHCASQCNYNAGPNLNKWTQALLGVFSRFIGITRVKTNSIFVNDGLFSNRAHQVLPIDETMYSYPVVVLSQDFNGLDIEGMHLFCERLTQLGNVVVSVKHTNNGCSVFNPFGVHHADVRNLEGDIHETNTIEEDLDEIHKAKLNGRIVRHSQELSFVLDRLMAIQYGQAASIFGKEDEEEGTEAHLLKGRLDLERISLVGHSESASTVIHHACEDRRIRSVVCIDAWLYPLSRDVVEAGSVCPILLLQSRREFFASGHDKIGGNNDDLVRKLLANTSHAYLFRLLQSGHYDILDVFEFAPTILRMLGLCGKQRYLKNDGQLFEYREVVVEYVREFLHKHVNYQPPHETHGHMDEPLTPQSKRKSLNRIGFNVRDDQHQQAIVQKRTWPMLDEGKLVFHGVELEKRGWNEN